MEKKKGGGGGRERMIKKKKLTCFYHWCKKAYHTENIPIQHMLTKCAKKLVLLKCQYN